MPESAQAPVTSGSSEAAQLPFADAPEPAFCGHCGQEWATSEAASHQHCAEALALEPPRYCSQCARRMKVQVSPTGWQAECSQHGRLTH